LTLWLHVLVMGYYIRKSYAGWPRIWADAPEPGVAVFIIGWLGAAKPG
jgi:hypothetical protein